MRARRGVERVEELCSGPGKLTQALGIELELNGTDLLDGPIRIAPRAGRGAPPAKSTGPRIGITKAAELPWRFCEAGSRFVSRPAARLRRRAPPGWPRASAAGAGAAAAAVRGAAGGRCAGAAVAGAAGAGGGAASWLRAGASAPASVAAVRLCGRRRRPPRSAPALSRRRRRSAGAGAGRRACRRRARSRSRTVSSARHERRARSPPG